MIIIDPCLSVLWSKVALVLKGLRVLFLEKMGYSLLHHTLAYIQWSRDLMERIIYRSYNQTGKVIKQWETYEGSDHHAER